jgi:ribosomal protein L39E
MNITKITKAQGKGTVKFTLEQAMKALRGNRGIPLFFLYRQN